MFIESDTRFGHLDEENRQEEIMASPGDKPEEGHIRRQPGDAVDAIPGGSHGPWNITLIHSRG